MPLGVGKMMGSLNLEHTVQLLGALHKPEFDSRNRPENGKISKYEIRQNGEGGGERSSTVGDPERPFVTVQTTE